jgi:signal transduction histidine kinase
VQGARPLPDWCEVTAYYVAAEAFTNAAKHANASAVNIVIEEADGTLTVDSPAGAGTVLTLLLPVTADNH